MKVAFFLENKFYNDIDFSKPQNGNPGIRGTQYMVWMVAYLLSFRNIEVHLFAPNTDTLPKELVVHKCETELEAVRYTKKLNIDIIVLRGMVKNKNAYDELLKLGQKCIVWSHNFENYELANIIAENSMIKANVCVGRQQYERLVDHKVFKKSTYIYNSIDYQTYIPQKKQKQNIVMYLGALEKGKGFYKLAKVWKKIVHKVPDAQLYVLGKGNMGSNTKLGKYGLAGDTDEKKFMRYLTDKNGNVFDNVHFMGSVGGDEKMKLMNMAKVGVITGRVETFCIVAVEFEALGIPVISRNRSGLLDTTKNKLTGINIGCDRQLRNAVIELLKNNSKSYTYGKNGIDFVHQKFNFDDIIDSWIRLLNDVINDISVTVQKPQGEFLNDYKWLRILNSNLQKIGIKTPSLLWVKEVFFNAAIRLKKTLKR